MPAGASLWHAGRVPRSTRSDRRARSRAHQKLVNDLERLARLQPGGAPDRPIEVASVAQIEVIATRDPCPLCEGSTQLLEHAQETIDGVRLRVVRLSCTACAVPRAVWFRVREPLQS